MRLRGSCNRDAGNRLKPALLLRNGDGRGIFCDKEVKTQKEGSEKEGRKKEKTCRKESEEEKQKITRQMAHLNGQGYLKKDALS